VVPCLFNLGSNMKETNPLFTITRPAQIRRVPAEESRQQ
jgi:hypothetical protein